MKEKCGHRIIQELSQCLFSVCFNNSISCQDYVLYEEMNKENQQNETDGGKSKYLEKTMPY